MKKPNKENISLLKKRMILFMFLFMLLSIFTDFVFAYKEKGTIGLLTVSETQNGTKGGVASLSLNIKPGYGRIYIDSFPMSRLDTQITMRFASELACDFLNIDCSNLDFFYTINADSSIVGGPSAGAAATVLTIAMLDNQEIDSKTIMTGTINSGYLIGPVAGISQKTLAAEKYGYKKALIPKWESFNETYELNDTSLEIIKVSNIYEALYVFTGKNYSSEKKEPIPKSSYVETMKSITINICSKYGSFRNNQLLMPDISYMDSENISLNDSKKDYFKFALELINEEKYYSAASQCFGGNVYISKNYFKNISNEILKKEYATLLGEIALQEEILNKRKIRTISDLETYMIVKERLEDAKDSLKKQNPDNISSDVIAYVKERVSTAVYWSNFFDSEGKFVNLNNETLKIACNKKISEVEERLNYLGFYNLKSVDRSGLNKAYDYYYEDEYALCIFAASKAKAEVDVILSALFLEENSLDEFLDEKLDAASMMISGQIDSGVFPILGYSYYEYANSLKEKDPYSAMLYAEYALEMSNLDMYLGVKKQKIYINNFSIQFIFGFVLGVLFVLLIFLFIRLFNKSVKKKSMSNFNSRKIKSKK
ncbi:MAG: S16 family serine protease [Candidatus Woesearchaeota archaeon]